MTRLGYRPALDGIRALAITLVVGYHAFAWPLNGWLGVDLFFVLSGFLITTLLLEERAATGRVAFGAFYARRARRLLPAMFAFLLVFTALAAVTRGLSRSDTLGLGASVGYFTNIVLGFHAPIDTVPEQLGPLWSLSTEEQFYLLWPLLLFIVLRGNRRAGAVIALLAGGFLAVRMVMLYQHGVAEHRLLFSPDTRPVGLAVGCLAGIVYNSRPMLPERTRGLGPLLIALVALLAIVDLHRAFFGGLLPLYTCLCALLIVATLNGGSTPQRLLALPPIVYLGRISYSLYLWHLPVLLACGALFTQPASTGRRVLAIAAAVAVAAASYHFVERPFLWRSRRVREARRLAPAPTPS